MPAQSAAFQSGLQAFKAGRYSEAIASLEMFCQVCSNPRSRDYVQAQMSLAKAYHYAGESDKALALIRKLARSDIPEVQTWAAQVLHNLAPARGPDRASSQTSDPTTIPVVETAHQASEAQSTIQVYPSKASSPEAQSTIQVYPSATSSSATSSPEAQSTIQVYPSEINSPEINSPEINSPETNSPEVSLSRADRPEVAGSDGDSLDAVHASASRQTATAASVSATPATVATLPPQQATALYQEASQAIQAERFPDAIAPLETYCQGTDCIFAGRGFF